ncbi:MAG: hypothetical protein GXO50_00090 [Chlorobi bacterium]|nr:hypothetical protein [Chlorobiota bacterium]
MKVKLGIFIFFFGLSVFFYAAVFSQNTASQKVYVKKIEISGNEKTKPGVILRELTLKKGDSVSVKDIPELLKNSEVNLLKLPLFNFAEINFSYIDSSNIEINVNVIERWYFWPQIAVYYADRNFSNWLKNKDFSRTDLGLGITKYNFGGRNEKLTFFTVFGYDRELIFRYENFYFDKARKHSGAFYVSRLKRKETGCIIEDDEVKQIKLSDEYALKSYNISFKYNFRKGYYRNNSVYAGFEHRSVSDSLLLCNPGYFTVSDNDVDYFYLKYIFLSDKRDSRVFPLEGHKFKFTLIKNGLKIFQGNGINSFKIKAEISEYIPLSDKLFFGNNVTAQTTLGDKNPFFLNTALGYSSSIRAYEYYAVNGSDFILVKNTLNFELLPKKIIHLKFLPWDKFNTSFIRIFADAFVDFAYVNNDDPVYDAANDLANTFLIGAGAGINVLTYYDWLFRLDFSVNKRGESGFYLHFEAPF